MADIKELSFDGYVFATPEDCELAKNEVKKISYIESHTDMTNLNIVKSVYNKALEERYFQTPIGLEYMRELQKAMENGGFSEEEIKPIPLYTTFRRIDLNKSATVKKRVSKAEKQENLLRAKYNRVCFIAGFLGFLIAVMLIITFNGTTPNALNYKAAINNQYASWEQELKEREAAVREKERELNINY